MQQSKKTIQFMRAVGDVFKEIRQEKTHHSISKLSLEYEIDRGNLSKIERGIINCRLITAWKVAEAAGITFTEFAQRLEDKLGKDFILFDE